MTTRLYAASVYVVALLVALAAIFVGSAALALYLDPMSHSTATPAVQTSIPTQEITR